MVAEWDLMGFYPLVNYHNYGKSLFLMGKSSTSMAMFNSFLYVYQRVNIQSWMNHEKIRISP